MKKLTYIIIGVLLVTVVTAGFLSRDRTIRLTEEQKQALERLNLTEYNTIVYAIGEDKVKLCLEKQDCRDETEESCDEFGSCNFTKYEICVSLINKCKTFKVGEMEKADVDKKLDEWERKIMKEIADAEIKRFSKPEEVKTEEGETIITK